MTCTNYRRTEDRIDWFLSHNPSGPGMCAQHSWHSLGGDKGCPPAWGCENANAIVDKEKAAGRLYTTDLECPPRGALVLWKYGSNGHAAISLGDGTIATTDPTGDEGGVGIEPITYPKKWGASNGGLPTGWSDYYNGVTFDVTEQEGDDMAWTKEDQDRFFNSDSVNSGKPDNPTWALATFLQKMLARLEAIEAKIDGQ